MITTIQAKNGLVKYIDNDMLPHLTGVKKIGLGIYTALAADNLVNAMEKYREHPAVAMLGVVDADGNIDIDRLYQAAAQHFQQGERVSIDIPLIGPYTVDKSDLESLYRYMKGG